jgi:hypothetical protein
MERPKEMPNRIDHSRRDAPLGAAQEFALIPGEIAHEDWSARFKPKTEHINNGL